MTTRYRPLAKLAKTGTFVNFLRHSRTPICRRSLLCSISASFGSQRSTRSLSTTVSRRAALAGTIPSNQATLMRSPNPQALKEENEDEDEDEDESFELLPAEDVKLVMTDRAAERLKTIAARDNDESGALRISVMSGGCHGYQYQMNMEQKPEKEDYLFAHPSIRPSNILIDAVSLKLLNGSTVDFATELIGSSFCVVDNPQAKGSGCGCGVSWELK